MSKMVYNIKCINKKKDKKNGGQTRMRKTVIEPISGGGGK